MLLSLIAVILIVPQVDLPDTAFQRSSSPMALHALSHHVHHANANASALRIPFEFANTTSPFGKSCERGTCAAEDLSIQHQILRC